MSLLNSLQNYVALLNSLQNDEENIHDRNYSRLSELLLFSDSSFNDVYLILNDLMPLQQIYESHKNLKINLLCCLLHELR